MKDPALYSSGYERIERDAYYTPAWCTEALLRHVDFYGLTWEPAVGEYHMADVLKGAGVDVITSDINMGIDFLTVQRPSKVKNVITNPPYSLAKEFIEQALGATGLFRGKVAMLLRNEYDSASTRQHLFSKCPQFALKLVLTKRPRWFSDNKASPRHNFSWFVWDWAHEGPAEIRWDQ